MNGLEELLLAAAGLEATFARYGWRFCFIGGVAVQRWGDPRFTEDLDLTLLTGFGDEEKFVDTLLKELNPRRPDAREFALNRRVLLAQTRAGVDVDIALGALPFEERSVARASVWHFRESVTLTTCSAPAWALVFAQRCPINIASRWDWHRQSILSRCRVQHRIERTLRAITIQTKKRHPRAPIHSILWRLGR